MPRMANAMGGPSDFIFSAKFRHIQAFNFCNGCRYAMVTSSCVKVGYVAPFILLINWSKHSFLLRLYYHLGTGRQGEWSLLDLRVQAHSGGAHNVI